MGLSELASQLPACGPLAAAAQPGRLPGLLVFALGVLVGGLTVGLVSMLPAAAERAAQAQPASGPPARPASPRAALSPPPRARRGRPGQQARQAAPPGPPRSLSLRIGLLGSLTVNGQAGALVPAQSQLVVALALHPGGLPNGRLRALLGADPAHPKPPDSLRQLIARTRRALGRAADGKEWIEHLGHGRYALHPDARVDWREFCDLTAAGLRQAQAGPLTEALNLIRGQPFAGCYYWWLETAVVESVTAAIVSAAERLAGLSLAGRDPAGAVRAARIGLAADPSAEQLWRVLMTAEHAAGNLAGVREAWSRCVEVVAEVAADGQPESATSAVYDRLLAR